MSPKLFRILWQGMFLQDAPRSLQQNAVTLTLTLASHSPVVLTAVLLTASCTGRWAQHPHPKQLAWPTRPGCLSAMPPLLTVLATWPDLSSTTTPTVSCTWSSSCSRSCRSLLPSPLPRLTLPSSSLLVVAPSLLRTWSLASR